MCGVGAVGRLVHHEGSGSSVVEEVDGLGHAARVRGGERTREVWEKVDALIFTRSIGENTRHGDQRTGVGSVVANDGSVHHEGQYGLLVRRVVLLQQRSGVVVADGHVRRTLCRDSGSGAEAESDSGGLHVGIEGGGGGGGGRGNRSGCAGR